LRNTGIEVRVDTKMSGVTHYIWLDLQYNGAGFIFAAGLIVYKLCSSQYSYSNETI